MAKKNLREGIIDLLLNKAALKQDVADYAEEVFTQFKELVQDELEIVSKTVDDTRVRLKFKDKGKYEFRVFIGSDVLVFQLHSNIFRLPGDDPLWKTKYLKKNGANGFFAIINIYNFLAESFEHNRSNDAGYLIGRVFLNHDDHFMVEGKGQLGTLFKDLEKGEINEDIVRQIIQSSMAYAIEFDLITPPYDTIQQVSVTEINAISSDLQLATGKRLGFRFSTDDKDIY
jgi:hypothetical protein